MQDTMQSVERQRQAEEDNETRGAALARQRRREREREQDRARERIRREREAFGGCYAPVLEAMLQPLPKQACPCRPGSVWLMLNSPGAARHTAPLHMSWRPLEWS